MTMPMAARENQARGALLTALAACLLLAWPAGAGAAPHRPGELSPALARLAKPALRSQPPARQAAALGLPTSGPGSLLREGRRVLVKVRFGRGALAGLTDLRAAGARIVSADRRYQTVTVAAPPASLPDLTTVPGVRSVWESRAPILYGARASAVGVGACEGGAKVSEGLGQLAVDKAREAFGLRGKGVTVGVLSDSFDVATEAADGSGPVATHAHQDIVSGDLPGPAGTCSGQQVPVDVLDEGPAGVGEDEGRGMLQIVHDLAPHASLAFATAFESEESFAHNIEALARPTGLGGAGAQVIVDDVAWFEEPFFQDGPVAVAVNKVSAQGVTYLTSAGNDNLFQEGAETAEGEPGIASWEAPFRDSEACPPAIEALPPAAFNGTHCMDFQPAEPAVDETFGITVEEGATLTADLQWAEPWNGVNTDLDAFLLNEAGKIIAFSAESNTGKSGTQRPFELLQWENPSSTEPREVELVINRFAGGAPRLKLALLENGSGVSETEYSESSGEDVVGPTVFGHAGAASAISVAAVPFNDSSRPEEYSSRGPVTHYFEPVEGLGPAAALGPPETVAKPDLAATDCGETTFFAQLLAGAWRFCGTSAAAPHAGAVAALLRQGSPTATAQEVREALTTSAVPVGSFGSEAVGTGLIDALAAVEALPLAGPVDDPPSTVVPPLETEKPNTGPTETPKTSRPLTFISFRPPRLLRTHRRLVRVAFRFASEPPGASFLCELDAGPFVRCRSPFARMLRPGRHVFRVKARNASGLTDPTPAVYRFRIVRVS